MDAFKSIHFFIQVIVICKACILILLLQNQIKTYNEFITNIER